MKNQNQNQNQNQNPPKTYNKHSNILKTPSLPKHITEDEKKKVNEINNQTQNQNQNQNLPIFITLECHGRDVYYNDKKLYVGKDNAINISSCLEAQQAKRQFISLNYLDNKDGLNTIDLNNLSRTYNKHSDILKTPSLPKYITEDEKKKLDEINNKIKDLNDKKKEILDRAEARSIPACELSIEELQKLLEEKLKQVKENA